MNFAAFISIAIFWSGSFVAIKPLVEVMPPMTAAAIRIFAALVFMFIVILVKRRSFYVDRKLLPRLWLAGLFAQGLPFSLLFWGEQRISPGLGGILNATAPIGTFVLGHFFLDSHDRMTVRRAVGLGIGIFGIGIIFYPKIAIQDVHGELLATIAVLFMAFCYSIATVMLRKIWALYPNTDSFTSQFHQLCASLCYLLPLALITEQFSTGVKLLGTPWVLGSLIYLGWISSGVAFLIYNHLIRVWGAVRAVGVAYLLPPATMAIDFLVNHRVPSIYELFGVAFILCGIALIQKKVEVK